MCGKKVPRHTQNNQKSVVTQSLDRNAIGARGEFGREVISMAAKKKTAKKTKKAVKKTKKTAKRKTAKRKK